MSLHITKCYQVYQQFLPTRGGANWFQRSLLLTFSKQIKAHFCQLACECCCCTGLSGLMIFISLPHLVTILLLYFFLALKVNSVEKPATWVERKRCLIFYKSSWLESNCGCCGCVICALTVWLHYFFKETLLFWPPFFTRLSQQSFQTQFLDFPSDATVNQLSYRCGIRKTAPIKCDFKILVQRVWAVAAVGRVRLD